MAINWNLFSKQELISILAAVEEEAWVVEKLEADAPMMGFKDCSCDPVYRSPPKILKEICDNVHRRENRPNPLARLLRGSPMGGQRRRQA